MKGRIKIISVKKYKGKDGIYRFPFEVFDKTPGGKSLGRIEWRIELIRSKKTKGRYYIEKILLWATQTRDKRYRGKLFEIPCWSESITGDSLKKRDSYLHNVWKIQFCEVHKNLFFSAYPDDNKSVLEINPCSSISIDIDFN